MGIRKQWSLKDPNNLIALIWGFAEATFFFIVPDVWTSRVVLKNTQAGFVACLFAIVGALIGGSLLFYIGGYDPPTVDVTTHIPGISLSTIQEAHKGLESQGLASLFAGAISGIPYKVYALQAAETTKKGILEFLIFSLGARAARFGIVTSIAWGFTKLNPKMPLECRYRWHTIVWIAFYIFYFWHMGL